MPRIKEEKTQFTWPDFIIYDKIKLYRGSTYPNFAMFTLPNPHMPKIIYLSKQQYLHHLNSE